MQLSVVLPVYQEQTTIGSLLSEMMEALEAQGFDFEIVAVDDGSEDGTLQALEAARARSGSRVNVVRHLYNRGNGAALRTGLRVARGDIVVCMDADGQHSPAEISSLISLIPPYDLVIGARSEGYRGPWHRRVANRFFNGLASWLSRTRVSDLTSGFRAMRRSVVLHFLPLFPDGFSAPTTTTLTFLKAGYNVAFVPIKGRPRSAGHSKIRLWADGMEFITLILRIITLYDPLRIFLPTGGLLAILGVFAAAAGMLRAGRLVLANSAILMFLAAIITWLLGLIASQIAVTLIQYRGDETLLVNEDAFQASGSKSHAGASVKEGPPAL